MAKNGIYAFWGGLGVETEDSNYDLTPIMYVCVYLSIYTYIHHTHTYPNLHQDIAF